jgi:hypothetical protein
MILIKQGAQVEYLVIKGHPTVLQENAGNFTRVHGAHAHNNHANDEMQPTARVL